MKIGELRSSFLLRRFSILYLVFALTPLLILLYFYLGRQWTGGSPSISEQQLAIIIGILGVASLLSFFAMRTTLAKVAQFTFDLQKVLVGNLDRLSLEKMTQEEGEVAELAKSFNQVISRLECNIEELQETKKALHRTLSKIGSAVSSIEDFNVLLRFILETTLDAIGAKVGAVFSNKNGECQLEAWSAADPLSKQRLLNSMKPFVALVEQEKRLISLRGMEGADDEKGLPQPVVCAPLIIRSKYWGSLVLCGNRQGRDFDAEQLELIAGLSSQMATLFQNSELAEELEHTYFETMQMLAQAVEARDPYSCGHSKRVGEMARQIGQVLGLPESELQTLYDAALLHDIGKIGIADSILRKPGPLSPQEAEIMRRHSGIGESIVKPLRTFSHLLEPIRHHHEFLDGSGYPDGLESDQIPLITRVLTVADIFDALTSKRPYRNALVDYEALETLQDMAHAGRLDPDVVAGLEQALRQEVSRRFEESAKDESQKQESRTRLSQVALADEFYLN